uniref:Uncharacterized protein n=1 Tax=Streptomyces sp. NBC_00093 TaxID=2975649 RepID=A0AAU2A1R1_9ACTN
MTTVPPSPYSPYATADPDVRHLIPLPPEYGPPTPGTLLPAGCHELAAVSDDPTEIDPATEQLPSGLCALCVASMRGLAVPDDTRPLTNCRTCGGETRYNSLCALCRAEAHQLWQAVRTTPAPTPTQQPERGSFVALGGPLRVTAGAFCEHGDLAFAARLHGFRTVGDQHDEQLDLVLPRCYTAKLIGSVLAIVDHESGAAPEAHERFTDTVNQSQAAVRHAIEHMAALRNNEEQR